jgi:hypothetical protein
MREIKLVKDVTCTTWASDTAVLVSEELKAGTVVRLLSHGAHGVGVAYEVAGVTRRGTITDTSAFLPTDLSPSNRISTRLAGPER